MMTLKHGTLHRYNQGCRCLDCVDRMSEYRQQKRDKLSEHDIPAGQGPGPVELAVCEEIAGAVQARPGVAAVAVLFGAVVRQPAGAESVCGCSKGC